MNPFRRTPPPPDQSAAIEQLARTAAETAEAAARIAEVSRRQAAMIGAQADEIARLRRQLAETQTEATRATQAAAYWYTRAEAIEEQNRRTLPATLARNLQRFAAPN